MVTEHEDSYASGINTWYILYCSSLFFFFGLFVFSETGNNHRHEGNGEGNDAAVQTQKSWKAARADPVL